MTVASTDVLMITHKRPNYTRRSLAKLLDTCHENMRVWVWHNGDDPETLAVGQSFLGHPRLFRFHHSATNERLRTPTNWLWSESDARLLGKVDDDCLVSDGWAETLAGAHKDNPGFGVIGSWHFREEDFNEDLARRKIQSFQGGHHLLRNLWLGGSGYLMKRECVVANGLLGPEEGWSGYCVRLARRGWVNGWYFPFIYQDHMDDPRSEYTALHTDEDLREQLPLSASSRGVTTITQWEQQMRDSARVAQSASLNPRSYSKTAWRLRTLGRKLRRRASEIARRGEH